MYLKNTFMCLQSLSIVYWYMLYLRLFSSSFWNIIKNYDNKMKKKIGSKYYVPVRTLYGFLYFVNQTIITEIWCIYDKEGL